MPGPTCAPITAPTSPTETSRSAGSPRACGRGARRAAPARSGLARCATATSTCRSPPRPRRPAPRAGQRAGRRTHLLERADPPVHDLQQRLHRQRRRRAAPRRRRSGRRGGGTPGCRRRTATWCSRPGPAPRRRPPPRSRPVERPRPPPARRTRCAMPTCRVSTARTGTDASRAASWADSKVPLISPEMCTETISSAPSARGLLVGLQDRRRRRPRRAHRGPLPQRVGHHLRRHARVHALVVRPRPDDHLQRHHRMPCARPVARAAIAVESVTRATETWREG